MIRQNKIKKDKLNLFRTFSQWQEYPLQFYDLIVFLELLRLIELCLNWSHA